MGDQTLKMSSDNACVAPGGGASLAFAGGSVCSFGDVFLDKRHQHVKEELFYGPVFLRWLWGKVFRMFRKTKAGGSNYKNLNRPFIFITRLILDQRVCFSKTPFL